MLPNSGSSGSGSGGTSGGLIPGTPAFLNASVNPLGYVELYIDCSAANIDGSVTYLIERARDDEPSSWVLLHSGSRPTSDTYVDTGVSSGQGYTYRVRACNGFGCSGFISVHIVVST